MAELKTRLVQLLDLAQSFQRQLIADFPSDSDQRRGTWEQWSLKDELAHIIAWQLNSLARIAALMHAELVPDFNDYERINRAIFDTNRDRKLAEIVAEGDRARADLVALIRSVPEADLAMSGPFGDQESRSLAEQILNNGFEHPILHYAGFYQQRGELAKGTQLYQASVAAVADWPEQYGNARYNLACFYALSGQIELALAELREALQLRPNLIEWSKQDPDLAALRTEPAYQALYQS
jgi:tetratricopeptide (TPR) repeat protein